MPFPRLKKIAFLALILSILLFTSCSSSVSALESDVLWSYNIPYCSFSTAAVSDGRVYVGGNDNVYCFDAATGKNMWIYKTGGTAGSPTVSGGRVYVGSWDRNIYCLDANTGALIWSFATTISSAGDVSNTIWVVVAAPAVSNGRVFVGSAVAFSTYDPVYAYFYYLDAATGKNIWRYPLSRGVNTSPTVSNGHIYVGSWEVYLSACDGNVYCLDAYTGAKFWSYQTEGWIYWSSPALDGYRLYVSSNDRNVYCLEASTGYKIWNNSLNPYAHGDRSSPAVANAKVYVTDLSDIYCLNAYTGAKIWSNSTFNWLSSPTVFRGRVYYKSSKVVCLDADTGASIWAFSHGDLMWASAPTVAVFRSYYSLYFGRVKVYVGSDEGSDAKFYCLDGGLTTYTIS